MRLAVCVLLCSIVGCTATQAPDEPRAETYARPPASVVTPHVVETRIGTPSGREANWIQTVPGKGWFVILRLHGPLPPWFDETWRPRELERVA